MHILIVDDEIYIRELVAKYLKHEQYETSFACNGLEAIELVKQNNYDLVIMDIMMPCLDGFSAVKEIRKFSFVPVIMLSARSEEYDKIIIITYNYDVFLERLLRLKYIPFCVGGMEEDKEKISNSEVYNGLTYTYNNLEYNNKSISKSIL